MRQEIQELSDRIKKVKNSIAATCYLILIAALASIGVEVVQAQVAEQETATPPPRVATIPVPGLSAAKSKDLINNKTGGNSARQALVLGYPVRDQQ